MKNQSRSPRGGRGLKYRLRRLSNHIRRRSPRGGRGLKFIVVCPPYQSSKGRSPRGGRGLKSATRALVPRGTTSLSSRRAWIEMRSL